MGCSFSKKSCYTNPRVFEVPNPDPSRWVLLDKVEYKNGYVLKVRYVGCTNFEGIKIMVYEGKYSLLSGQQLDPHFAESENAPFARFKPTQEGWEIAKGLANRL